jgi:hypothetical protein
MRRALEKTNTQQVARPSVQPSHSPADAAPANMSAATAAKKGGAGKGAPWFFETSFTERTEQEEKNRYLCVAREE